jgi:hypothetical protein
MQIEITHLVGMSAPKVGLIKCGDVHVVNIWLLHMYVRMTW